MKRSVIPVVLVLASLVATTAVGGTPIVIAHRGASGYLPEHTLAAYGLAIDQGADYIEPDLVLTKDGVPVARHEHYLGTTTDVADHPEFAGRKRTIDGREDWFSEDFTLAEIRTLRARQAFPGRSPEHDGIHPIPTLQEVIDLVRQRAAASGRTIGIYPETKHPGHFKALGFDFARILLDVLEGNEEIPDRIPVYIQSFEPSILVALNELCELPLIQLVDPADGSAAAGTPNIALAEIARFAEGVGANKALLVALDGTPTRLVQDAHALGLVVHAWTFRNDAYPAAYFPNGEAETRFFLELGIDGFFTDFPDSGVQVRNRFLAERVKALEPDDAD